MKKELLELLICPECLPREMGLVYEIRNREGDEVIDGMLSCRACGHPFPIAQGIADMRGVATAEGNPAQMQYENPCRAANYLWSHYADIMDDPESGEAYGHWSDLIVPIPEDVSSGMALDIGTAVGRFSLELRRSCQEVIGIDYSVLFLNLARQLIKEKKLVFQLNIEGELHEERLIQLPQEWPTDHITLMLADTLKLPFPQSLFNCVVSLNVIDKVPKPLVHLTELDRVACSKSARTLISDPFSWSTTCAAKTDWLGGKDGGRFPGRGVDNVKALLQGRGNFLDPPWDICQEGRVTWKIRNHQNHYELIYSQYIEARR